MISTSKKGNEELAKYLADLLNIPYIRRGRKRFERLVELSWQRREPLYIITNYKGKEIVAKYRIFSKKDYALEKKYVIKNIARVDNIEYIIKKEVGKQKIYYDHKGNEIMRVEEIE